MNKDKSVTACIESLMQASEGFMKEVKNAHAFLRERELFEEYMNWTIEREINGDNKSR